MKRLSLALALPLLLASTPFAHAEIQKNVPQTWPGKIMIGVRPLGAQLSFTDTGFGGTGVFGGFGGRILYKLGLDVAGIVLNADKITLWFGGELNVGGRGNLAMIEPGLFVAVSLEKLLKMPLVPIVRAGISGPLYIPYGYNGSVLFGAFQIKFGGGAYYFLTKNIGVGLDINVGMGPGIVKVNTALDTGFSGYAEFLAGARFAL